MVSSFRLGTFLSNPHSSTNHQLSSPLHCSKSPPPPQPPTPPEEPPRLEASRRQSSKVDSTDWVASSLTRRFGLGAGLAWVGFLAFGVVSEQIKTRLEVSNELANTRDLEKEEEVVLPNGIMYYEMRVGGGATPRPGDLVVIDIKGTIKDTGEVFADTFGGSKRPLALVLGSKRYSRGMCDGIEYVLRTMKAGGKRRVIVPPTLAFGEDGEDSGLDVKIPPNATLEYVVEIEKVSIAPA